MPALDPTTIQVKDYLHVKGVRLIEPGMPQWKIKPMQEKNMKLIAEYLEKEEEKQKEEARWAAIPEWKQQLLKEKEKKLKEAEEAQKQLEEAERKEREKFESLPQWKQQLLIRKKSLSDIDVSSDNKSETSSAENGQVTNNSVIHEENAHNGKTVPAEKVEATEFKQEVESNGFTEDDAAGNSDGPGSSTAANEESPLATE